MNFAGQQAITTAIKKMFQAPKKIPQSAKIFKISSASICSKNTIEESKDSPRIEEFRKKLRETTPISDLGEQTTVQVDTALPAWPDNKNPHTGEVGGPRGPEPTRYGDWERKGRVTDF